MERSPTMNEKPPTLNDCFHKSVLLRINHDKKGANLIFGNRNIEIQSCLIMSDLHAKGETLIFDRHLLKAGIQPYKGSYSEFGNALGMAVSGVVMGWGDVRNYINCHVFDIGRLRKNIIEFEACIAGDKGVMGIYRDFCLDNELYPLAEYLFERLSAQ
jgi:hypothetical protein